MGDDRKTQDEHKVDLENVTRQVGAVDATTAVSEMLNNTFLGGGIRFFGKTDFEGHRLNDMIDLVEGANPADLEAAGKALWDARDAIKDAADELSGHIERVEWEGESAEAFHTWGKKLVAHTQDLATFADAAGTQITAAGTGLASVRKSMPPRDHRSDPKTVDDIPTPKRVEGNDEYAAAVQAEKHRQEAINQMNRLASFYAVSEETLGAQEPPTFEPMPAVGVPQPNLSYSAPFSSAGEQESTKFASVGDTGGPSHREAVGVTGDSRTHDATSLIKDVDVPVTTPDRNVGTEIDSVGTLPDARPATSAPPSATGQAGAQGGTPPALAGGGPVAPAFGGTTARGSAIGRAAGAGGTSGARTPASAQGRAGAAGARTFAPAQGRAGATGATAGGRGPMGPVGRTAAPGQAGTRGSATARGTSAMGRGVTGGVPRSAGTTGGRTGGAGATGAGRAGGVVGGKPATGSTPSANASRMPRGTVIGGEGAATARTTGGKLGQRGVIGAPQPSSGGAAGRTSPRPAGNADGVVGAPKSKSSQARKAGRPSGGAGAARGSGSNQGPQRADDRGTSRRERSSDDETHSPDSARRDVPPAAG
ncbi:WXG100 family type VII secretion target [Streptomyces sp. NPDC054842]